MEAVSIASTAVSVLGALGKSDAQSDQYTANAQANEYNAAVLRKRAETVKQIAAARGSLVDTSTNLSEEQQRMSARLTAGSRTAAIAQSGVGVDSGSNFDLDRQAQVMAELDSLNIRYSGQLQKHDILQQADLESEYLTNDAELAAMGAQSNRNSASSADTSGLLGAAGALLGGTGDYLRVKSPGRGGVAPRIYS